MKKKGSLLLLFLFFLTHFCQAFQKNSVLQINFLSNKPSYKSQFYAPLMFHAVYLDMHNLISYFLDHGFELNTSAPYCFDHTPLHHALAYAQESTALFLIQKGAPFYLRDKLGNTPLHTAAQRGFFYTCKLLIKKMNNIDEKDEHCYTPLHTSIEKGNVKIVKLLLKKGADVNARTCTGDTPLHLALIGFSHFAHNEKLKKQFFKIIKEIIQYKPNISHRELINRWNVFELLKNLEVTQIEYDAINNLLHEIKRDST